MMEVFGLILGLFFFIAGYKDVDVLLGWIMRRFLFPRKMTRNGLRKFCMVVGISLLTMAILSIIFGWDV